MTHHNRGTRWFLAQCKPNSHNVAKRNLVRQGFSVFLPLQETTRRARGRFVTQMRPLFPGYLFVVLNVRIPMHPVACSGDIRSAIPGYPVTPR